MTIEPVLACQPETWHAEPSRICVISGERNMDKGEMAKVETYLRRLFSNAAIRVTGRPKKTDSAEVYIGDEFIGVLFEDTEDGDKSYNFQMAILDTDLE
jgi:ABC-type sulfate transport system substrate-binding protein